MHFTRYVKLMMLMCLTACSPIRLPVINQYNIDAFSSTASATALPTQRALLISVPEALSGYQTEQMLYIQKPHQLSVFSNNAWVTPPANMLFPLLIQTFQASHAFSAITSSPYADKVDYRLDSQLLAMQQNFLTKPSHFELSLKITLTRVNTNHVLFSRIINESIPCTQDTPYGGVLAANTAAKRLTARVQLAVLTAIQREERMHSH